MRTADTLAKRHDGQWVIVHSPDVPIHEQREALRGLLGLPTHPEFALLQFSDSDGDYRAIRFGRPANATPETVDSVPAEPKPKTSKKENAMKKILSFAVAMLVTAGLHAASWNDAFGIGGSGNPVFAGSGQTLAVVTSVRSNSLYFVTSHNAPGAPVFENIAFRADTLSAAVELWVPTNTLTVASNGAAGDTTVWLVSSNTSGGTYTTLATNDVLVYASLAGPTYQTVILSGNATSAQGVVTSNALGQVQIKLFNALTNAPAANDVIYKMARVQTFSPLTFAGMTNSAPYSNMTGLGAGQWVPLQLSPTAPPITFSGNVGAPALVTMTFSNAAGLHVTGSYRRRN